MITSRARRSVIGRERRVEGGSKVVSPLWFRLSREPAHARRVVGFQRYIRDFGGTGNPAASGWHNPFNSA